MVWVEALYVRRRFSYLTVQEALDTITTALRVHAVASETCLLDDAFGRILAEDIVAPFPLPPRDTSHFDGYALRAEDTADASVQHPVYLTVVDHLYPGQTPTRAIHAGEACYITTGAFLPTGADSVLAVEATQLVADDRIEVRSTVRLHDHVIRKGSDIEDGQILFRRGHALRAQDLSACAALHLRRLAVYQTPVVAFLCVGDELTDDLDAVPPGAVGNSLRYAVAALIRGSGGSPLYLGIAPDDVAAIRDRVDAGLSQADLLLVLGGSSMGAKDVTAEAVASLGPPGVLVHGLKRKPGRVSGFAVVRGKPVVLLPGLCNSLVVGFHALALPLLHGLSGLADPDAPWVVEATLTRSLTFTRFLPFEQVTFVHVTQTSSGRRADPCVGDSSSFSVLARANAFIITPPQQTTVQAGAAVEAYLLPGFSTLPDLFAI